MERHKRKRSEGGGNYFALPKDVEKFIPSGSKVLDLALGGGWAKRRIANVVGDKSTGKTLLAIEASANFCIVEPKGEIKYREAESAFDKPYAGALGMPLDRVDFGKPLYTVEDMYEDLERIIAKAKNPIFYILDSLDALSSRAELGRSIDGDSYGTEKAKKMSELFRRINQKMAEADITLMIISQIRDKIGATFGKKYERSGGNALDFYASHVVYLAHIGRLYKEVKKIKRSTAVKIKAKCEKNKVGLPFREADFTIRFGYGIDDIGACLDWLNAAGSLDETGMTDKELQKFELAHMNEPSDETREIAARIHRLVEKRWWEIESSFLPKSKKYGG